MDSSSIELPGSEVESITLEKGQLKVRFSRADIVKTMTGSLERTRWWQAGELVFGDAEIAGPLPHAPLVCAGGDLDVNVYTYRDMIPIPLESRGNVRCELHFEGTDHRLSATAENVRLALDGTPKYIEHIRPK